MEEAKLLAQLLLDDNCTLDELDLIDCEISEEALVCICDALKTHDTLHTLVLRECKFTQRGWSVIADLV